MSRVASCYGFRLSGLGDADGLLIDAPGDWPALELRHAPPDREPPTSDSIDGARAHLVLRGGWVELERPTGVVTFRLAPRPPDRDLVHPYPPVRRRSPLAGAAVTAFTPAPS